jgi:hypothetical protein
VDADAIVAARHAREESDDLEAVVGLQSGQRKGAVLAAAPAEDDGLAHAELYSAAAGPARAPLVDSVT